MTDHLMTAATVLLMLFGVVAAVGSCRNCSAALCGRHVVEESQAVTTQALMNRVVELPVRARRLLCKTCADALGQPRA